VIPNFTKIQVRMKQFKILVLSLVVPCFLLAQNPTPGLRHEVGITPFTVGWDNATFNQPIVGKWYYRGFYNYHFSNFAWANSLGYGKNIIQDEDESCYSCFEGKGKLEEYVFDSGIRWLVGHKPSDCWVLFLELGPYFSHIRYTGSFAAPNDNLELDKTEQVVGIYGQLGLSFSPTRRSSIFALTNYHSGWDKFGKEKSTSQAYNILQLGISFYLF